MSTSPQSPAETVPARLASSLLLVRPAAEGIEVFALRRAGSMAFSAHATAFPGGRVDPADDLPAELWRGVDLDEWARRLGTDAAPEGAASQMSELSPRDAAGRLLAAALRETYEETGVLLALDAQTGAAVDPTLIRSLPEDTRTRLEAHELAFGDLLAEHGLVPDVAALVPWSRWITPVGGPRRYDTVFFVVRLPEGQEPERMSSEAASHGWSSPEALLAEFRRGTVNLMTPSWWQLRQLSAATQAGTDWADILALGHAHEPVRPVMLRPTADHASRVQEFLHAEEYLADLASFRAAAQVEESPDNVL
jgi:8-oxo-dGTP pyrophosphatase MutT (NUDIX family)